MKSIIFLVLYKYLPFCLQAIRLDTGLRVAVLCGESVTLKLISQLYDDSFDVLVATAGALSEFKEIYGIIFRGKKYGTTTSLKGQCHEIFCFWFFS